MTLFLPLKLKRLSLPKKTHFQKLQNSCMMEFKKKKFWLSLNAENQLSGFFCLEKIGKGN